MSAFADTGPRTLLASVWAGLALSTLFSGVAQAQLFRSPVSCSNCINYYYYLDEGQTRDWNCGSATYEGHRGTDYSLRNGNAAIVNDNEVVAMADGVVVHSEDGYYDRCTQCGGANCGLSFGNGFANHVIINHGSYRTVYGHMKQGSIAVRENDTVKCGQLLGFIGSSGCSSGAHLHIEPSRTGQPRSMPIDPYVGDCSPTTASMFVNQGAYRMMPGGTCEGGTTTQCPADVSQLWKCNEARTARRRCVNGAVSEERCSSGCTSMPVSTDDVCALPPDADKDGSRTDTDCNDNNASVHPGALEICGDSIDQDCSGADLPCDTGGSGGSGGAPNVGGGGSPPLGGTAGTNPGGGPNAGLGGLVNVMGGNTNAAGGMVALGGAATAAGSGGTSIATGGTSIATGGVASESGGTGASGGASTQPSGGALSAGSGGAPSSGTTAKGGTSIREEPPTDEAGCGCRTTPGSSSPRALALLGLLAFATGLRRRKTRATQSAELSSSETRARRR